jgi:hypothetical protein
MKKLLFLKIIKKKKIKISKIFYKIKLICFLKIYKKLKNHKKFVISKKLKKEEIFSYYVRSIKKTIMGPVIINSCIKNKEFLNHFMTIPT